MWVCGGVGVGVWVFPVSSLMLVGVWYNLN